MDADLESFPLLAVGQRRLGMDRDGEARPISGEQQVVDDPGQGRARIIDG